MKRALLSGITGQDGSYLAELLLAKNYKVYGLVRRTSTPNYWRIAHILDQITLVEGDMLDQGNLMKVVEGTEPDEVYNLAAQSFVGTSWSQPTLTAEVNGMGTLRLLESIRIINPKIKFYQASTSELFGSAPAPQNEQTFLHPRSPYGVSKLFAHWTTINYRESYGIFAVCGILFNHESPRRGIEFLTRKVTDGVARIKFGLQKELRLGILGALRDWGHAADYMECAHLMMQNDTPQDYVCGTGESHPIWEFCDLAFSQVGLNYRDHVVVDEKFFRKAEVYHLLADPSRIKKELGWKPRHTFEDLVKEMVDADMERVAQSIR